MIISISVMLSFADNNDLVGEKVNMGRLGCGMDAYCKKLFERGYNDEHIDRFRQYALRCEFYENAIRDLSKSIPETYTLLASGTGLTLAGETFRARSFDLDNLYFSRNLNAVVFEFYEVVPQFKDAVK